MQRYLIPVLLCLSLGLAPHSPEPHIVGKIRWVLGGAEGMALMDWGDLLMHGAPWVFLAYVVFGHLTGGPSVRVSGAQAREAVAAGAILVDVRSPGEFAGGHIDGAINIPVGDLAGLVGELPADGQIVVCCASGMRSGRAVGVLKKAGFERVMDLGAGRNW